MNNLQLLNQTAFPKGAFCLSFDCELAWGMLEEPVFESYRKRFAHAREVCPKICSLLDKYEMPATWAVVGRLMTTKAESAQFPPPSALARIAMSGHEDEFHATDLLELVQACKVPQEIASHSFSHLKFLPNTPHDTIREELALANKAASLRGIRLESFVFPCNIEGHHEAVKAAGFRCFRGAAQNWYPGSGILARAGHWADQSLGLAPSVSICSRHQTGLWNLPASAFLMPAHGVRAIGAARSRLAKVSKGLQAAGRLSRAFHLWTHPHNFYAAPDRMLDLFERILEKVAQARDKQGVEVLTMAGCASKLDSAESRGNATPPSPTTGVPENVIGQQKGEAQ